MLRSRTGNRNEGVNKHSKYGYKTVKHPHVPSKKFIKAHLYKFFTGLILETYLSEYNKVDVPKDEPDSDSSLLVNSTSANTIN